MINYLVTHLSPVIAANSPGSGPLKRLALILPSSKHDEQIQQQLISWDASYFFDSFSSQLQCPTDHCSWEPHGADGGVCVLFTRGYPGRDWGIGIPERDSQQTQLQEVVRLFMFIYWRLYVQLMYLYACFQVLGLRNAFQASWWF